MEKPCKPTWREAVMRRELIEALTYPRLFVLENIEQQNCPHDGRFESSSERCRSCNLKQECHWMRCLNDFSNFASKPTHTIHASLLYSIKLIETNNQQLKHNSKACICESCSWTRSARQLTRDFQSVHLGNPFVAVS